MQFVYVSKGTFSSNIMFQFSFLLKFFMLQSTNREADDVQIERKGSCTKLRLANQRRRQVERELGRRPTLLYPCSEQLLQERD